MIPVSTPWLGSHERELILEAMESGWISGTGKFIQQFEEKWATNVYWVYGIVLGKSYPFDAMELQRRLKENGIETRQFFLGLHEQPILHERGFGFGESYPIAEYLSKRGLYLPSGTGTSLEEIHHSAEILRESLAK